MVQTLLLSVVAVMFAYEQCLLVLGHHPDIWYEAAQYLEQSSKLLAEKGVRGPRPLLQLHCLSGWASSFFFFFFLKLVHLRCLHAGHEQLEAVQRRGRQHLRARHRDAAEKEHAAVFLFW